MKLIVDSKLHVYDLPSQVLRIVRNELTLPNPEYVSRRRMGRWVPKGLARTLSLVEADRHRRAVILPRGYLDRLLELARGAGVQVEIEDRRLVLPKIDVAFVGTLRPYQSRAVGEMSKYGSGILQAPCGSGKTAMAMALVARWRQPALLIAHTKDLVGQLEQAAVQWLGTVPGRVGDGVWAPGAAVTAGLVQSLAARPEDTETLARSVGLVILDEAHHAPAETFVDVIQRFRAAIRYGLTATPDRKDGLGPFMNATLGPIRAVVTTRDLEEAGVLVRPKVEFIPTTFQYEYESEEDYQAMITVMVQDDERNALIIDLAAREMNRGAQVLVLTERVGHAQMLAQALSRLFPG
ncbi:MAG: DEAD/DEAH box helicase family protein, partial [Firmicutes bacterium]|nr:DEAD/DEAH box helicase family protein [Bacillota bacterium]